MSGKNIKYFMPGESAKNVDGKEHSDIEVKDSSQGWIRSTSFWIRLAFACFVLFAAGYSLRWFETFFLTLLLFLLWVALGVWAFLAAVRKTPTQPGDNSEITAPISPNIKRSQRRYLRLMAFFVLGPILSIIALPLGHVAALAITPYSAAEVATQNERAAEWATAAEAATAKKMEAEKAASERKAAEKAASERMAAEKIAAATAAREAAASAQAAQKADQDAWIQNMTDQGYVEFSDGIWARWRNISEYSCGYLSCAQMQISVEKPCSGGFYVEVGLYSGNTAVGISNDITPPIAPADGKMGSAIVEFKNTTNFSPVSFRLSKLRCL